MADKNVYPNLENAVFGLLAGLTATHEMLIAKNLVDAEQLASVLQTQQQGFAAKGNLEAVAILALALRPLTDGTRQMNRAMLNVKPEGTA